MALQENGMKRYGGEDFLNYRQNNNPIFKDEQFIYTDGSISPKDTSELVNYFNTKKNNIKVIIGTDAIAQGINLFRMREVHLLEPWFNLNKTDQIIGRGTRKVSHKSLPLSEQNITIYLHISKGDDKQNEQIKEIIEIDDIDETDDSDDSDDEIDQIDDIDDNDDNDDNDERIQNKS